MRYSGLCVQVVVIAAGYCTRAYRLKTGSTQVRYAHTSHNLGSLRIEAEHVHCWCSEGRSPQSHTLWFGSILFAHMRWNVKRVHRYC